MAHAQQPGSGSGDPFRDPAVPQRSIIIENRTGSPQRYFSFSDETFGDDLSENVYRLVQNVAFANDQRNTQLNFPLQYFAIQGTRAAGSYQIIEARDIDLATGGQQGTKLGYSIENGIPRFRDEGLQNSFQGNFQIQTDSFNLNDVRKANFFVGIGTNIQDRGVIPYVTFEPQPQLAYFIRPQVDFTFTTGDHKLGSIIAVEPLSNTCTCDFGKSNTDTIRVTHNQDGSYTQHPTT